ncbi:hypothetical protein TELCIR_01891 [Teladorsagia circumcincta]|uniref:Uncharacterized protein n=1 Tax=Teladorsagia circumcincta TaxID=45464 RepID=A0A2G9V0R0_TELCI|nr:hypothetical protein TELCIR_01891 [Teladorsagia circumcincta]
MTHTHLRLSPWYYLSKVSTSTEPPRHHRRTTTAVYESTWPEWFRGEWEKSYQPDKVDDSTMMSTTGSAKNDAITWPKWPPRRFGYTKMHRRFTRKPWRGKP